MGWKYRIVYGWTKHKNRYVKGGGEFNQFWNIVQSYAGIEIFNATVLKNAIPHKYIAMLMPIGVILYYCIGWFWDVKGLNIIEAEYGHQRNSFIMEIRKKFNLPSGEDVDTTFKENFKKRKV